MLVETQNTTTTNIGDVKKYSIEANKFMFKMLSSDIYSDKISAVIRELSTNAYDTMIEAGTINKNDLENSKKYEVHLPTTLEPFFSIRDYGTGLDEEGMACVYTYGKSTRRNTNDAIGVLGIGAKSPYAYSKSGFTVNSYINGKVYTYSSFLNDGEPAYTLLEESDTDEPNGLEVTINVKNSDVDEFKRKALDIFYWFNHKPKLNIELKYDEKYELLAKFENFLIVSKCSNISSSHVGGVLMGNILYGIPSDLDYQFSYEDRSVIKDVVIKAEIGDVSIHPSREYLDGDEKTKKFIQKHVKAFKEKIDDYVVGLIGDVLIDESLCFYERFEKCLKIKDRFDFVLSTWNFEEKLYSSNPRIKGLKHRINEIHRLPYINNVTTRSFDNNSIIRHLNVGSDIYVINKPLKLDSILRYHRKKNIGKNKINVIKLNNYIKLENGRVNYAKQMDEVRANLSKYLCCSPDSLIFTDEILEKTASSDYQAPKPKVKTDRSKKFVELSYLSGYDGSIHSMRGVPTDIKNVTEEYYYIYLTGKRNLNLFDKSVPLQLFRKYYREKIFDLFQMAIKKLKPDIKADINLYVLFRTEVSPKMIDGKYWKNALDIIKEAYGNLKINDYTNIKSFRNLLFNEYQQSQIKRYILDNEPKSKIFKILKDQTIFDQIFEFKESNVLKTFSTFNDFLTPQKETVALPQKLQTYLTECGNDVLSFKRRICEKYISCEDLDTFIKILEDHSSNQNEIHNSTE